MTKILTSRNRYVIPFMFNLRIGETFDSLINNISRGGIWCIKEAKVKGTEQDLYDMVLESFTMNSKQNNLGCTFIYNPNRFQEVATRINYTRFERDYIVEIENLGGYLLRTGIGFLWYEIRIPDDSTIEEFTLFQNEFKELTYERFISKKNKNKRNTFELENDRNKAILMGHWLDSEIMSKLPLEYSYFANKQDPMDREKRICDKALIYNYTVLDSTAEDKIIDAIYHITNGYNERYKPPQSLKENIIEPFDGAYCYVTRGGCGYFALPSGSNTNFYMRTFRKKIMLDYFMLYILAQYQAYSILKFTKNLGNELSAECDSYRKDSERTLETLKKIETEINVFLIKSVYASVSHISHQNDYYEYLIRKLQIRENIDSLTVGLESLEKLQESRERERLEMIENLDSLEREIFDDRLNIGLGMLSILAIISAVADGFGSASLLADFLHLPDYSRSIISIVFLIIITLTGIVAVTSIISSIKRAKDKRERYKKIKSKKEK